MTKENLGIVLWTIQMQVEEQMLKPMEKLFHNGYSNNVRFFGGGAQRTPMDKSVLAINLGVLQALHHNVKSLQSAPLSEEQETSDNTNSYR